LINGNVALKHFGHVWIKRIFAAYSTSTYYGKCVWISLHKLFVIEKYKINIIAFVYAINYFCKLHWLTYENKPKKHVKIVISGLYKFSQTVSQNSC